MYFLHRIYEDLKKWLYDLPKIGPWLKKLTYGKIFESIQPGEIAIDCGANVGLVTRRLARSGVKVYAFEPDPQAFTVLEACFRDNLDVTCINKAVSDHKGETRLYFHRERLKNPTKFSTASSLLKDKGNVDEKSFTVCEVIDLSDFISHLDKPVALLKIDIEGEEVRILNALIEKGVTGKIRHILVETHERIPSLKIPTEALRKRIFDNKIRNIDLNWA